MSNCALQEVSLVSFSFESSDFCIMSEAREEKVYVKLVSAEGQEFFVDKEIAMVSKRNYLSTTLEMSTFLTCSSFSRLH